LKRSLSHAILKPGSVLTIPCGPPFTLETRFGTENDRSLALAYRRDKQVALGKAGPRDICLRISLTDRAGNLVTDITAHDGTKPSPPVLKVAAEDGTNLDSVAYEYG